MYTKAGDFSLHPPPPFPKAADGDPLPITVLSQAEKRKTNHPKKAV